MHGVRDNGVVFTPQPGSPTLARVFHDAGLKKAAFVGAYVLDRRFGLADGFDIYDDRIRAQWQTKASTSRPSGAAARSRMRR